MTGRRGDIVVWDDPHSPEKAYSEADRETTIRVFKETLPTRLVDPERSAIIVVMQRLHEGDVSGEILANDYGYEHLCLPMEFEPNRRCKTSIGWSDPRKEEGELLMEARFPRSVVERDKKVMGRFATAGQFQQRPVPREGALFSADHVNIVDRATSTVRWVRGWDLASTTDVNAPRTAGVKVGVDREGLVHIGHATKFREAPFMVEKRIRLQAQADGRTVTQDYPIDPGAAGVAWAAAIARALGGFVFRRSPETGDKVTRAMPLAAQWEADNVVIVDGDWVTEFLDELLVFPGGKFLDQVDAASRAYNSLMKVRAVPLSGTQEGGR
jgi:predicted phage terminase large subunit-like protein